MPRVRGRSTADHVAQVAGALFYRHGIHGVGVDRVALEAGVTKRTVYKHFPTKELLIAAGLRAGRKRFPNDDRGAPRERILAVFDGVIAWTKQPDFRGCPHINAAIELADATHPGHVAAVETKALRRAWFRDRLTEMNVRDADASAEQLLVVFDGAVASSTVRGPDAALAARALVERVLAGLDAGGQQHGPRVAAALRAS